MDRLVASLSVGVVGGTTLVLVGMILAAIWLSGWYDERARRAEVAVRRGARLRRGFGVVRGTARPADGRSGGLLVSTTRTQIRFGNGDYRDVEMASTGSPTVIVLDSGEEIEIDPNDVLVEGGPAEIRGQGPSRELVHRVSAGDTVWATGVLHPRGEQGAGAYRSGMARARITAPRRGRIVLSGESPVPRWRDLAAAHKAGAYLAAGVGAVVHLVVFRSIDLALLFHDRFGTCFRPESGRRSAVLLVGGLLACAAAALGWRSRVARARAHLPR